MRRGRYYLGRVVKFNLDQNQLMDVICNAPIIEKGSFEWTITDVIDNRGSDMPYVFGKLSKYAKDGHVKVIDEVNRSQIDSEAPNLLEASSPFVYLPEFSGISFLHVWNGIQEEIFPRRFKSIIEEGFDNFFVGCDIEPVSDYRAFTTKLAKLEKLTEISARVYPPNPLFGRLWGDLNDYISKRNASEVSIKERTGKEEGLKSEVIELMNRILDNSEFEPELPADISDAAILMAADGYGRGSVSGVTEGEEVVIKTSDTQKSFVHSKEPEPEELANITNNKFSEVSDERDMDH